MTWRVSWHGNTSGNPKLRKRPTGRYDHKTAFFNAFQFMKIFPANNKMCIIADRGIRCILSCEVPFCHHTRTKNLTIHPLEFISKMNYPLILEVALAKYLKIILKRNMSSDWSKFCFTIFTSNHVIFCCCQCDSLNFHLFYFLGWLVVLSICSKQRMIVKGQNGLQVWPGHVTCKDLLDHHVLRPYPHLQISVERIPRDVASSHSRKSK